MFNKFILLISAIACMAGTVRAQDQVQPCATDEHYRQLLKEYPQLAAYQAQFNAQLNEHFAKTTAALDTTTYYDVPIVVHVVHDYGSENLTDDAIFDAASYWAIVYVKQNEDTSDVIPRFVPYIGNPKIRLHLATIDPNGNPTKGIKRYMSYLSNSASDLAKYDAWPNNKYINIWFIGTFGAASAGAAAYAYYPSSGAFLPYYDGVISLASYANTSKTIPHELGHVLNLEHVWGNTNAPDVACGDDEVEDTPPTKGHNPSGCAPGAIYDTTCAGGDTVNAQNIMDYTYCSLMFTTGQTKRMRTALTSTVAGRNNLFTPANLLATGALAPRPDLAPIADYIMNKGVAIAGITTDVRSYFMALGAGNFVFRNASWNDTISSIAWSFSNGASVPTSSSTTTVSEKFSVPGWVTVSLTATSNAGTNTLVNPEAVYVADTAAVGSLGYQQSFSNAASVANWPMVNYYNNQFKWEFYTGAGVGDNSCIRYRSFDTSQRITGTAPGDYDDIFTPAFNLGGLSQDVYFNFYTSGAATGSGSPSSTRVNDSLELDVSTSGGARWAKVAGFSGTALDNNTASTTSFVPGSASAWVARSVTIPAANRSANTFFRLRYRPGNTGNNLYVDNMSLSAFPAGITELVTASANSLTIFPNPSSNGCNMAFKTGSDGVISYIIKDVTGKLIYQDRKVLAANTVCQETIARSVTPIAGMYFVTLIIDGTQMTQKMVVY